MMMFSHSSPWRRFLKSVWIFLKVAFVVGITVYLLTMDGKMTVLLPYFQMEIGIGVVILLFILIFMMILAFKRFFDLFLYGSHYWIKWKEQRKQRQGEEALFESLNALMAGEKEKAQAFARKAHHIFPMHPLPLFIATQTNLPPKETLGLLSQLEKNPHTKLLAVISKAENLEHLGQFEDAKALWEQAYQLRSLSPKVLRNLLAYAFRGKVNVPIEDIIAHLYKIEEITKQQRSRFLALYDYTKSKIPNIAKEEKARHLKKSFETYPGLPFVAIEWADLQSNPKHQEKILKAAYDAFPHQSLISMWEKKHATLSSLERYQGLKDFTQNLADHPESLFALAQSACHAELWGQALQHLSPLIKKSPTQRVCLLMSKIEKHLHKEKPALVEEWRERALQAPKESSWTCSFCSHHAMDFSIFCQECGTFDSYTWKSDLKNTSLPQITFKET